MSANARLVVAARLRRRGGGSRRGSRRRRTAPSRSVSSASTSPVEADRPERAARCAEGGADLLVGRRARAAASARTGASSRSAGRRRARARGRPSPSSFVTGIAFDVAARSTPRNSASASQRRDARRLDLLGRRQSGPGTPARAGRRARSPRRPRSRRARSATSVFSPEPDGREEVDRQLAAHDPALRLHGVRLDPAALEDPVVRLAVLLEARLGALLVAVERVGVLHDELADAEQAASRARLVPVLDGEVVPELRQLLVRADLARVERERLLVRAAAG